MNEPDATSDKPGRSNAGKLLLAILVAVIMVALWFVLPGGNGGAGPDGDGGDSAVQENLVRTRAALAATENLEMVEADTLWSSLYQLAPEDESVALNRAINRVLRVDQLSGQATNASLGDAEKKAARSQLPEAISAARDSITAYGSVAADPVLPMWLKTRVDLHEASLLPGSMTKSLRRKAYDQLSEAINGDLGTRPTAIILGGTLIQVVQQMEDPIDGLPEDLLRDAAKTVGVLSDQHADNLFFALRAARLNIATRNQGAARFVDRAAELARAIEPSLRRETQPIGVTPDELVAQITGAIESQSWSEAENRMLLWFNVLNSTEIVKTDRRRATPHPLDRLSFDSLRRLSADVVAQSPLEQGAAAIQWEPASIATGDARGLQTIDFDLDLDPDLISSHDDGTLRLWENDGEGSWTEAGQVKLDIRPDGILVADLFLVDSSDPARLRAERRAADEGQRDYAATVRHNTFQSVIVYAADGVRVIIVDGRASTADVDRLKMVESETGLESVDQVTSAVAGDWEADGDVDVAFSTSSGMRLFINRGNRTFFEVAQPEESFAADDPVSAMAIADLDRDLDLDIVTVHAASGRVGILENLLHLQFRGRYLDEIPTLPGASSIAVEDIDGNVSWDLIVAGRGGALIAFSQTAGAGAWTVDEVKQSDPSSATLLAADFDNDAWMELLACDSDQVRLSRIGPWGFGPWQGADAVRGIGSPVVADFDRDGALDVAGVTDGQANVLNNRTSMRGHHVDVRFKGIDDNVSGRVNHYAIGSVLELRFGPHYRARIVTSPATHFGTDGFDSASSVRAILPNGLTQTIRDPNIDSLVEEEQTLKGSCPYLYAWDGEKYVFQTDCLWAAPLGLQVASGVVAKDRPWEYLKIDGDRIRPRGDRYDLRITEELWEVAYFDEVALSVVDHPADVEVWTNEKVGPATIASPRVYSFRKQDVRPLRSAVDTRGRDVTARLARTDRDFVQGFDRRIRQGLCEPHWIDLDFGLQSPQDLVGQRAYLILTGWILPTDTSLNIQIDQNPKLGPIEFPSVWVPDAAQAAGWRNAIPFMGFPGGKTKTIVVEVTDVIVADDPRFRVRTSAQIYWDSARIAIQSEPAEYRVEDLELLAARVDFHGFSDPVRDDLTHPETYDYQSASGTPRWPPLGGTLTRFGDCIDLVRDWDDAMVVIGAGDELRLGFSLPEAELPPGWKRDFILHSVGWDKDADLNTLSGQSTMPLPYREMSQYPPPAGEVVQTERLERLNRHHLQRRQGFRAFWYRAQPGETGRFQEAWTAVE